jgi:hypothetical protein
MVNLCLVSFKLFSSGTYLFRNAFRSAAPVTVVTRTITDGRTDDGRWVVRDLDAL